LGLKVYAQGENVPYRLHLNASIQALNLNHSCPILQQRSWAGQGIWGRNSRTV